MLLILERHVFTACRGACDAGAGDLGASLSAELTPSNDLAW